MTVHARPPHTQVVGVCSWTHHFEDVDFDCDSPCAVGSDECDGTDHPHHVVAVGDPCGIGDEAKGDSS